LTLLLVMIFMVSMLLIIFGQPVIELIITKTNLDSYSAALFKLIKWFIVTIFLYFGITLIYRYGSAMKKRIKWVNTGALLATVVSIVTSIVFAFFINNFGKYNEIYGSIGALLVLLLWIQINALIVLIGFELNAGIAVNKARMIKRKN